MLNGKIERMADVFLKRVVEDLRRRGADYRWMVIFPTKRARLLFLHYWQEVAPNQFPPKSYAWMEFIEGCTPWILASRGELLLYLYRAYLAVFETVTSFEGFSGWGSVLLRDIDELDRSLVDVKRLCRTAADWEQIRNEFSANDEILQILDRFWESVAQTHQSVKSYFLHFWQSMPALYAEFRRALTDAGKAYRGMMERWVAESPGSRAAVEGPIALVGFDFLGASQIRIWQYWKETTEVLFYWDIPQPYLRMEKEFQWRIPQLAPLLRRFTSAMMIPPKELPQLIAHRVPSRQYQLSVLLNELGNANATSATGVIVPSEDLLTSLIYYWPDALEVNLSAGLPLSATPIAIWLRLLAELRSMESAGARITHELFENLRRHPYLRQLFENVPDLTGSVRYVPLSTLPERLRKWAEVNNPTEAFQILTALLEDAYRATSRGSASREGVLWLMSRLDIVREVLPNYSPEEWLEALSAMASVETLFLEGNPMKGVQVLGLHETPGLEFRQVHMLDFVEKKWPPAPPPSMIPYPIRQAFGMMDVPYHTLTYYLQFYRLAERAERIHVYVPDQDVTEVLEPSRLLSLWDGTKTTCLWQPQWRPFEYTPENLILSPTGADFARFRLLLTGGQGIAPSALNKLRKCPRLFFLSVIREIPEPQHPLPKGMDARLFGNVLHRVMEALLVPYLGRPLGEIADAIIRAQNRLRPLISHWLANEMQITSNVTDDPYLLLMTEAIAQYILTILWQDRQSEAGGRWRLHAVEQRVHGTVNLMGGLSLRLRGYIDRTLVREDGAVFRIEDYKTGRISLRDLKVTELSDLFADKVLRKGAYTIYFQQLIYALLLHKTTKRLVHPAVWALRSINNVSLPARLMLGDQDMELSGAVAQMVEEQLRCWIEPMLKKAEQEDPSLFAPNPSPDKCRFCQFAILCQAP